MSIKLRCNVQHIVTVTITLVGYEREVDISCDRQSRLQDIIAIVEHKFNECKREDFELWCGKRMIDSDRELQALLAKSKHLTITVRLSIGATTADNAMT